MLPRFNIENLKQSDVNDLLDLYNGRAREEFVKAIMEMMHKYDEQFDGIVLECQSIPQYLFHLVNTLSMALRDVDKLLILVISPISKTHPQMQPFDNHAYLEFEPFVDYFSLMTYDYATDRPSPNAPFDWVEEQLEKLCRNDCHKVLLGLNFYGYNFGPKSVDAITGNSFLDLIKSRKDQIEMEWDNEAKEHKFQVDSNIIYYPTVDSIQARVDLAQEFGCGISIWEIGQGLDQFYPL